MEIQFFRGWFSEGDLEFPIDHVRKMASGEAPFFPTTLSLVYRMLAEKVFPKRTLSGSDLGKHTEGQDDTTPAPSINTEPGWFELICHQCDEISLLKDLRDDLYCPQCPESDKWGNFMHCPICGAMRVTCANECPNQECRVGFM